MNCEKKQSSIQIISYNSLFKSIIKVNWKRNHFSISLSVEYWNIFWGDFLGHNWLRFTWSDPLKEKKKDSGKYIAKTNTVYYGYIYPINWEQIKKSSSIIYYSRDFLMCFFWKIISKHLHPFPRQTKVY